MKYCLQRSLSSFSPLRNKEGDDDTDDTDDILVALLIGWGIFFQPIRNQRHYQDLGSARHQYGISFQSRLFHRDC